MVNDNKSNKKPFGIRLLGATCSLLLIGAVVYVVFAGFNYGSALLVFAAIGGLAGPSVLSGDGVTECLNGTLEMFIEGIQSIFEAIAETISSIFG